MPYALCPMPYALCPIVSHVTEKGYSFKYRVEIQNTMWLRVRERIVSNTIYSLSQKDEVQ
jgi:hypothetical protein